MKLIFYGNILYDGIETYEKAEVLKRKTIEEFLIKGMELHNRVRKLIMPRKIIRNYPDTLDKDSELYVLMREVCSYFGDGLISVDYIPVSGDLMMTMRGEIKELFLSNILLAVCVNFGDIRIEE